MFLAPVVKSTLLPLKPILCSPTGRGFNIIQMPSDTACEGPGDTPKTLFSGIVTKTLFSGIVTLNGGDCIRSRM